MTTPTDTPRTDAYNNSLGVVPSDFARQIERELNESRADVERLRRQLVRSIEIAEETWKLEGYADKDLEAELNKIKEDYHALQPNPLDI